MHWFQNAIGKISVHGLTWYQRSNSNIIRSCILIFAILVLFGLPTWTVLEFIKFYNTIQIRTVIETGRDTVMNYPNLTVCHSRYFDNQILSGINKYLRKKSYGLRESNHVFHEDIGKFHP